MNVNLRGGGMQSTEVAFALLIQRPRVLISALLLSSWTVEIEKYVIHLGLKQKDFANALQQRSELITTKKYLDPGEACGQLQNHLSNWFFINSLLSISVTL